VQLLPSHVLGILSLILIPVAMYVLYAKRLEGGWRRVYVVGAVVALYYDVVEARHGREALARLAEDGAPVSLVLSDVAMPVMSGRELSARLAEDWPDIPLIWMSGHPRDSTFADGAEEVSHAFLQKPISEELLARVVAGELAKDGKAVGL
jgi:CheY-like chemotaxis protein